MKKNNNHRPDLPEEEIQKIIHQLSDTAGDDFNNLTHYLKQFIEKEKKKIDNRNGQLSLVLAGYDLMKEDRNKLILDKEISIQEGEEREEIIKKRDEIRKKQNNCKDCEKCNPHTPTFFPF